MNSNALARTALCGFIAGAVAYLVFHQVGFWAVTQAGIVKATTWSMAPTKPWGVPQVASHMFWTGLWGALGAFLVPRLALPAWLGWVLFTTVIVTLTNWFIVAPLKGAPPGGRLPHARRGGGAARLCLLGARHVAGLQAPATTAERLVGARSLSFTAHSNRPL